MVTEVFVPCPRAPWALVSDHGTVLSNRRSRSKRTVPWRAVGRIDSEGYPAVNFRETGPMRVHRLVCEAFNGPPPFEGAVVRHLNGIKTDNRATNLAWGTKAENTADMLRLGEIKQGAESPGWKDLCIAGHPLAGENIYQPPGSSHRQCRECRRDRGRRRYHRLIIMTDADVDGAHLRTLLLTLLYRQMPELVQRGYVYIAQPPLYKVKVGREERYLKDDQEEAQFMLTLALKDAEIISGGNIIRGEELNDLARQYVAADGVIARLSRVFDVGALSAMAEGVEINLDTAESPADSAKRLADAMRDPINGNGVEVVPQFDEATERHRLSVQRMHHGNVRVSIIDADFINGSDYAILSKAAKSFLGKVGPRSLAARGEGDKRKEQPVSDFREAMQWLRSEADRSISKQRYKGLGEMNPEQLWETTMDPKVRRLLRVQIEDAIAADEVFTTLMGDDVEPRRNFIETHALSAGNIDA